MKNYRDTLLSQYANSPTIAAFVDRFNDWIDPAADLDNFYNTIWNVETAVGAGLDIWGKIVNISRNITVDVDPTYFGFNEAYTAATQATGPQPFGQASMYAGRPSTQTVTLANDAYRKLIMVKAMANITNCTAPSINALLNYLFSGEGRCYVHDTGEMQIRYVFEFSLSAVELAIMVRSGAVPRPAGVLASVLQLDVSGTFGFNEGLGQPFNQGTFFTSSGLTNAV